MKTDLENPSTQNRNNNIAFSKPRCRLQELSYDVCIVEEVNRAGVTERETTRVGSAFQVGDSLRVVLQKNLSISGTFEIDVNLKSPNEVN